MMVLAVCGTVLLKGMREKGGDLKNFEQNGARENKGKEETRCKRCAAVEKIVSRRVWTAGHDPAADGTWNHTVQ